MFPNIFIFCSNFVWETLKLITFHKLWIVIWSMKNDEGLCVVNSNLWSSVGKGTGHQKFYGWYLVLLDWFIGNILKDYHWLKAAFVKDCRQIIHKMSTRGDKWVKTEFSWKSWMNVVKIHCIKIFKSSKYSWKSSKHFKVARKCQEFL